MKILYNLQLSAIDKETKEFLIDKDSNFAVWLTTTRALNIEFPGRYEHLVLIPSENFDVVSKVIEKKVECTPIASSNYIKSVFSSRYEWHFTCVS